MCFRSLSLRWVNFIKGVSITDSFDNDNWFWESDIWVKLWITAVFPGVGVGRVVRVSLFQVWEMAPGLCHILPQAGSTLRMAPLGYFLKSRRIGIGASSKWNLLMAAPEVFRGPSHIRAGVWYVRNQIHDFFFFIIQEKVIPFKKKMKRLKFTEAGPKNNKGDWLLSSSYVKAEICRGHRNSEDECKNSWGKKHSSRDRSMVD